MSKKKTLLMTQELFDYNVTVGNNKATTPERFREVFEKYIGKEVPLCNKKHDEDSELLKDPDPSGDVNCCKKNCPPGSYECSLCNCIVIPDP